MCVRGGVLTLLKEATGKKEQVADSASYVLVKPFFTYSFG
jgi:hypothetical protein